jgi:hypothetical protein
MGTIETGGDGVENAKGTLPGCALAATVFLAAPQYKGTLFISKSGRLTTIIQGIVSHELVGGRRIGIVVREGRVSCFLFQTGGKPRSVSIS